MGPLLAELLLLTVAVQSKSGARQMRPGEAPLFLLVAPVVVVLLGAGLFAVVWAVVAFLCGEQPAQPEDFPMAPGAIAVGVGEGAEAAEVAEAEMIRFPKMTSTRLSTITCCKMRRRHRAGWMRSWRRTKRQRATRWPSRSWEASR